MKPWTREDDTFLKDNYGAMPDLEIAKALGCKSNKIRQKARGLGLREKMTMSDIPHVSMKEDKLKRTPEIKAFHNWVASKGCIICKQPCNVHHEPYGTGRKNHKLVVGLCHEDHHQHKPQSRHKMNLEAFNDLYGLDIRQEAIDNWKAWKSIK